MSSSDFEKGMIFIKKKAVPDLKLQPDALDLSACLCTDLNVKLVKEATQAYKSNKKVGKGMNDSTAEMASRKSSKTQIKYFVATEAQM